MNLDQVTVFLTLADELHFGRTAERLVLSPTRVSRLVTALEAEIGGRLFDRTSRRVRLTPLGEGLRPHFATAYDELRVGMESAMTAARGVVGELRVGFTATVDHRRVRAIVQAFAAAHPECAVLAREVPVTGVPRALWDGTVDVLLYWMALDEPGLATGPPLASEPRVLVVPAAHPLAGREAVSVEEAVDLPMLDLGTVLPRSVADALVPARTPAGRPLRRLVPPVPVTTLAEELALVHQGHIVHLSVAPAALGPPADGLAFVPVTDLPPLPYGPIWVAAHENARIRAFAATPAPVSPPG